MPKRSTHGCAHAANDPIVEDLLILKQRIRDSSHLASNFARAIASVRAYAAPLRSASEAKKLRHIGNYLANQIHGIMRKRGLIEDEDIAPSSALPLTVRAEPSVPGRSTKVYAPAYRKQPWFVLVVLREAQAVNEEAAMSRDALLERMLNTGYEGNSVKLRTCLASLIGTHEVVTRSNRGFYYLTGKGQQSADLCPGSQAEMTTTTTLTTPELGSSSTTTPTTTAASSASCSTATSTTEKATNVELEDSDEETPSLLHRQPLAPVVASIDHVPEDLIRPTDTWELMLVLDHRETIERRNPQILERKLVEKNITCAVRALGIGDVQWIARRRRSGEATQEFMLNVIVERKEVHDLSGSILDRRFYEQKTRLATVRESCRDVHVIYLIEGSLTQITTVRTSGLLTAMGRTQLQNNFFVQQCQNADETVEFLARVYARLRSKFPATRNVAQPATSPLLPVSQFDTNAFAKIFCWPLQPFAPFNAQFRKKTQFTVHEIYQRMLLQVPGLSAAKTIELSAKYKNLNALEQTLRKRGRESEIEHVRCGKSQRRLGLKAREALGHLLTSSEYTEDA